jgi:hypothetical protein
VDVLCRLALADLDVGGTEIDRVAAKLRHACLETDTSPQRWLLIDRGKRIAAQSLGWLVIGSPFLLEPMSPLDHLQRFFA